MLQNLQSQYDVLVHDDRIHNSLYTDPRVFEDELERIFYRGWVFIGHESEVPQLGDFLTRFIGRQPVIMVRGKEGDISVLLNRCAHRGSTVCTVEQGHAKVCPYHGWTYDLGGKLLSAPRDASLGWADNSQTALGQQRTQNVLEKSLAGECQ